MRRFFPLVLGGILGLWGPPPHAQGAATLSAAPVSPTLNAEPGLRPALGIAEIPVGHAPELKLAPEPQGPVLSGLASFYGQTRKFRGRKTANGDRFNPEAFTGASNHFPLGTWVAVRRSGSPRCVVLRINDRMHVRHTARIADISLAAARALDMLAAGIVKIEMRALEGPPGVEPAICLQAFSSALGD